MEVIYLLVPLSLMFISVAIYMFYLAIKNEQFDDLEGPAHRILMDDISQRRHDLAAREAREAIAAKASADRTHHDD